MQVVFIASLSHSGSTLLDLMLNAHPQIASVGELKQLGRFANFEKKNNHSCTCGAPTLWDCPFWMRVDEFTRNATGQGLGDLNVETYNEREAFAHDNQLLFDAIAKAAGKEIIVDSSKNAARLDLLLNGTTLDVFTIFLVRDPKGQICSRLRKTKAEVDPAISALVTRYVTSNLRIDRLIAGRPHAIVRYEDLVRQPETTLRRLLGQLGLAFDPAQLHWSAQPRHNVGGNGMRRNPTSRLELDERWKEVLTPGQQSTIDAGTRPVQALLGRRSRPCGQLQRKPA